MKLRIITNPLLIDISNWSSFVYQHPYGNAFQTPEMYEVYKKTPFYEPIFVGIKDNEKILGILLAVVQREYSLPFGFISSRSIIWGGPLILDNDPYILNLLLKQYEKIARNKAIYSQFRNFWKQNGEKRIFENYGYKYEAHLNILIDLNKSEEMLWKEIDQKRRNEIRRAIKENVVCNINNNIDALHRSYKILEEVYKRAKLPFPKFSFFNYLFAISNENFKVFNFIAEYKNEIIGCMVILAYKNILYDFYAGSLSKYLSKYPNDLIPWEVFKWGKRNGYILFDFGGAGKPNVPYGVRDYKKKFGGEMVEYGRYEKIHHPLLMKIATAGFKVWQKIKF